MSNVKYDADSIQTMDFGVACCQRIGMYLSANPEESIFLGYREILCNSNDEHAMGYGNKIITIIDSKNKIISVEDEGRGIPVGIRKDGTNSLIAALTMPHTGAKLDSNTYAGAIGTNGIGSSVVNHTSLWFDAEVKRVDGHYSVHFEGNYNTGAKTTGVKTISTSKQSKTGTKITYHPNPDVYGNSWIKEEQIIKLLTEMSYFNPGVQYILDYDGNKRTIISKNGLLDALVDKKAVHKNKLHYSDTIDGVKIEFALQWTRENPDVLPYANGLHVPEGGVFYTGFKTSLTKTFNSILNTDYSGDIIRKYLDGFVSVVVGIPQFTNQSKTALANAEARTPCSQAIAIALKAFFAKNPKDAEDIKELLDRETKAERAAERAREAEKAVAQGIKKPKMISNLPAKLADANAKGGDKELFIVEGDSAAGKLKALRNAQTQGILPLRGKITNCYCKELADAIKNEEIKGLITTLGCGAGSTIDTKKLRYSRIIIATDADADGSHIALLLETLFLIHMPELIKEKRVYRVLTPFYIVEEGKKKIYLYNDEELNEYKKTHPSCHILRAKGLGALNDEETYESMLNSSTRKLQLLATEDLEKTIAKFNILMGKDLESRRELASSIDYNGEEID